MTNASQMDGVLWIVATPLGNADDLSPRAREIVAGADLLLAEDTRRAGLLLQRLGIIRASGQAMVSFFEHNEDGRIPGVLDALTEGRSVALVSDAGTPLVSDPGYRLVRACRERGFRVSPVPGPSAVTAALSASGLPPLPFTFLGFLPRKASQITKLFEIHGATGATLVFFERKTRLAETLGLARQVLGDREICIARELTKDFEEFLPGRLGALDEMNLDLRGEITVVVGPPKGDDGEDRAEAVLREEAEAGGKPREIARRAAARLRGWSVKDLYEKVREL